jgi:hypothetical protein
MQSSQRQAARMEAQCMAWDKSLLVRAAWNRGWGVFDSDPLSLRRNESHVFCDAVAFKPVPSDNQIHRSTAITRESGSIHQHHLPASRNAPRAGPAASGNDLHLQALWYSDCMQLGQVLTAAHCRSLSHARCSATPELPLAGSGPVCFCSLGSGRQRDDAPMVANRSHVQAASTGTPCHV